MSTQERRRGRRLIAATLGLVLVGAAAASAQTLSTPSVVNSSNANELFLGGPATPSYERETSFGVTSSAAGSFVTRFAVLVTADGDGGPGAGFSESLFADYEVDFTATAPGAYHLTVDTALRGDLHLVNDDANGGLVDIGAVSGFSTGGTVIAGGLGLPDAGIIGGSSGATSTIDESNSATIFGVSNGAPIAHTLRFQWSNSATTDSTPGDEAAVRLGGTSDVPTETAGDYPGSPARVQADDGHFVTVTIESLCGNEVIDAGPSYAEDCDEGAANGTAASCCSASCTFKSDGSACDDGNACTLDDICASGVCTPTGAETCGLCETCNEFGGCEIGPRAGCRQDTLPKKSLLLFKDKFIDTGDQVSFKWKKGEATDTPDFGDPLNTDSIALCVFDDLGALLFKSEAPAGGVCGSKACWKALSVKGFAYKDSARTPDGADKIKLKAGLQGKAQAEFKGKGPNLPSFALPFTLPVTAQLQSENGECWESTFSEAGLSRNTPDQFKAKAD